MADDVPGKTDAIRLAREDRDRTNALLASIDPAAFETTGLGGGTWSPKDLVGHLETWEENIQRKLEVAEGAYQVLSDQAAGFRTEFLELVVIFLILLEVVLALFHR